MCKKLLKLCSMLLVFVMVLNMLPLRSFAEDFRESLTTDAMIQEDISANAQIVEENPEKRTEYSKEFKMSNGLYMAAVYPDPVHYLEDGQWKDIDNTLKLSTNGTYTNTAGVWDVSFPQQLTGAKSVSITKDGYTLSFAMAGELRSSGELVTASISTESSNEALTVAGMQTSSAQLQVVDNTAREAAMEHPEMLPDKLRSRISYSNVYQNTNVVYDLDSNKVKESIILQAYSSTLRGYRYTLNVGSLLPVLEDSGQITLYAPDGETVVMVMPAPYLLDANYAYSGDIQVQLTGSGGTYTLTYLLPRQWLASEERAWPVVLDPVIEAETNVLNIEDRRISENTTWTHNHHLLEAGYDDTNGITRSYLKFVELPALTSSDVVVGATIHLYQPTTRSDPDMSFCVEVHKVTETWDSQTITWATQPTFTTTTEDYCLVGGTPGYYGWVVTDIVRSWYADGNNGLMFKSTDAVEAAGVDSWMQFASSDYNAGTSEEAAPKPILFIQFRNNNGLESYWDYTTSSAGRAGTGYVNNFTGNLVWVRSDIGFGGNRMPVSISHIYNANDAISVTDNNNSNDTSGNFFGLGYGWRTNFHQRLYQWSLDSDYYVWEDADGTDHYFKADDEGVIKDEDGLELTLTVGSNGTSKYVITDKQGNTSHFDTYGRLRKQQNNQATKSSITITYTTGTGPLISTITDGAGRVYSFTYTSGLLTRISYKGSGTTELSYVTFEYGSSKLTKVTDKDGKASSFAYSNNLLTTATDVDGYTLTYAYNTVSQAWQPYRVVKISEADGTAQGGELNIAYGHNQTTFTDHNGNVEFVQFNDFGNTVSVQDDEGHASFAQYALNTDEEAENNTDATKKGNQLRLSSKLQNTVGNRLKYSNFEASTNTGFTVLNSAATNERTAEAAYLGSKSVKMVSTSTGTETGIISETLTCTKGLTYTFSAYVKTGANAVYLGVSDGTTVTTGEALAANSDWTRLQITYTNTSTSAKTLTVRLLTKASGTTYIDCVQWESAPTASRFNIVENGEFRYSMTGWYNHGFATGSTTPPLASQLQAAAVKAVGSPTEAKEMNQPVLIGGSAGDTFVLSGWAKGDSAPLTGDRTFGLRATFTYTDGTYKSYEVSFNPDVSDWQYASIPFVAEKAYKHVTIRLLYEYNVNTAWFDGIQLYKEAFGSSYTYDEDGNVISVVDLQKQETTYEYDTSNNLTKVIQNNNAKMTYTYDSYHNVKTATTQEGLAYSFEYDTYGNNTKVSISDGTYTMSSSAAYTNSGNTLSTTTDALGNVIKYGYNANTNILEWVQYPEDTEATRTSYTYDSMYRLASAACTTDTGSALSASYTYTDDLLTKIQTGSTTYNFTYGDFGVRTAVKAGTRTLASYIYNARDYTLFRLDYGNGDKVQYTYDKKGRVTKETYEDGATVTYQYDNNGALATVTDSETGIKTTYYYDLTDRVMKYVESGTGYSHSVGYEYDTLNNLTSLVETINGVSHTTSYVYDDDNRVSGMSNGVASEVYSYDNLGRVSQQKTRHNGTDVLTRTFSFKNPSGTATSAQVATYTITATSIDKTYSYTYDTNGNILSVSDGTYTSTYTYDSANQLTRENNLYAGKTYVWTYDDAGNILSRTEYAYTTGSLEGATPTDTITYTYGNSNWGDLLTAYDSRTFSYDTVGNLTSDGIHTYTWKHGRQLATLSDGTTTWQYTYNADGLRSKKTDGTTTYNYVYDGGQLTQMTVGTDTLYFAYNANGTPMAVTRNSSTYYYVTNIQGDVIAIVNSVGTAVVSYNYDAWGNLLSCNGAMASTLGALNPLRYRGYVYDTETGLYYLQSRYYNPEIGRFINADGFISTGQGVIGNNIFAYCGNNPTMYVDYTGAYPIEYSLSPDSIQISGDRKFKTKLGSVIVSVQIDIKIIPGESIQVAGNFLEVTTKDITFNLSDGQSFSLDFDYENEALIPSSYNSTLWENEYIELSTEVSSSGYGIDIDVDCPDVSGTISVVLTPNIAGNITKKRYVPVSSAGKFGGFMPSVNAFLLTAGKVGGGGGLRMVNVGLYII